MAESGFEYGEEFYPWSITTKGKDLQIVDRVSDIPIPEFFRMLDDSVDLQRAPIVLALIGTSLRARHPEWSVKRIVRLLEEIDLSDVEFVGVEEEDEEKEEPDPTEEAESPPTEPSSSSPDALGSDSN